MNPIKTNTICYCYVSGKNLSEGMRRCVPLRTRSETVGARGAPGAGAAKLEVAEAGFAPDDRLGALRGGAGAVGIVREKGD